MKVAVVTPAYNSGHNGFLAGAVLSVARQSYEDHVHVVVDDGSTDNTETVVRGLQESDKRIFYIKKERCPNQRYGPASARNCALSVLRTQDFSDVKYVAFLDHDDMLSRDSLKTRVDWLEQGDVVLVYGDEEDCDANMKTQRTCRGRCFADPIEMAETLRRKPSQSYIHTIMFPLEALRAADLRFDEGFGMADDKDFVIRLLESLDSGIAYIPKALYFTRLHDGNLSRWYYSSGEYRNERARFVERHGPAEERSVLRFIARPHSYLPEPVKRRLRPVRDAARRGFRRFRGSDRFIEALEEEARIMFT